MSLRREEVGSKQKAPSIPRTGFSKSKSFGSLAIAYQRPIALRPTLVGSLPLSALKKPDFDVHQFPFWRELVSPCFNCFQLYYNTKKIFVKGQVFQLKTGYRFWLANDLLLAGEPSIL